MSTSLNTISDNNIDKNKVSADSSLFRTFSDKDFIIWQPWIRIRRILNSNGGSYGISGDRGCGKTWLLQKTVLYSDLLPYTFS